MVWNWTYLGNVTKIIDGDTVEIHIRVGFYIDVTKRVRLNGIDTPERGQVGYQQAKDALTALLPVGSDVVVSTAKGDSFDRWLGTVWTRSEYDIHGPVVGKPVNQLMLEGGWAKPWI